MARINIDNVQSEAAAAHLIDTLQGQTYMNIQIQLCPRGGSFDVDVETSYEDATEEDLTGMVLLAMSGALRRALSRGEES